jgi:23S rRNA (pseudouridine1915-N3)-methyltransferase
MLHILCISDSHKQFAPAVEEYTKRLSKSVTLTVLKPSRKDDHVSVIKEETILIAEKLSKLPKPRILLEKDGQQLSSEQLATLLEKKQQTATFIIWWPYGVDVSVLEPQLDQIISRGKQTMPHGLALVVMLEQLWRAKCIIEGRTYHY